MPRHPGRTVIKLYTKLKIDIDKNNKANMASIYKLENILGPSCRVDYQLHSKPVVKQRHPFAAFTVSQIVKKKVNKLRTLAFESR